MIQIVCMIVVAMAINEPVANECDSDGSCRPRPAARRLSVQEQFSEQLQRSRELRGLTNGPTGISMTRRLKIDRKERQRQRREAHKHLPPEERPPSVSPGCDPEDKLCDRRKRQEARRLEREERLKHSASDEL